MSSGREETIGRRHAWRVVLWWEKRRIPFNLAVLAAGVASVLVIELVGSRLAPPGEDVEEPLVLVVGIILYGVAGNICYTLGWVAELISNRWNRADAERRRKTNFKRGLIFSIGLTLSPAFLVPLAWLVFGFHHTR